MNSKTLAATTVFAALAIVLNQSPFKIPAPYAPFLFYQIWEIPIVAAFLLFGMSVGAAIAVVNTVVLFALFTGALESGPIYNLCAVLSMLLGMYAAQWLATRFSNERKENTLTLLSTILGIASRVAVMSVVNWAFLRFPPPLGFSMVEEAIIPLMPLIAFFNATLALYTIPIGLILARAVSLRIRTKMWTPTPTPENKANEASP
jgi:riboflavin transporter FmnP